MRTPMFQNSCGTRGRGPDVDPGLDGKRHARLEHPPFAAHLVVTHIVHIEAQPVAGAMAEEGHVGLLLDELRETFPLRAPA